MAAKYKKPRLIAGKDVKPIDDEELESLYMWVDGIPLSRPKRNLARDFADGGKNCYIRLSSCVDRNICELRAEFGRWGVFPLRQPWNSEVGLDAV